MKQGIITSGQMSSHNPKDFKENCFERRKQQNKTEQRYLSSCTSATFAVISCGLALSESISATKKFRNQTRCILTVTGEKLYNLEQNEYHKNIRQIQKQYHGISTMF